MKTLTDMSEEEIRILTDKEIEKIVKLRKARE